MLFKCTEILTACFLRFDDITTDIRFFRKNQKLAPATIIILNCQSLRSARTEKCEAMQLLDFFSYSCGASLQDIPNFEGDYDDSVCHFQVVYKYKVNLYITDEETVLWCFQK